MPPTRSNFITVTRNRRNFFARFRVVAAGFLTYAVDRNAENPAFDDCPTYCDTHNDARSDYCSNCPIGILREQFRDETKRELAELPGSDRYGFDYLNECVINALSVEHLPREQQTATTARLLRIIEGERSRMKRVKDWNDKQKAENAGK